MFKPKLTEELALYIKYCIPEMYFIKHIRLTSI